MSRARQLRRVTPLLEGVLSRVTGAQADRRKEAGDESSSAVLTEITM